VHKANSQTFMDVRCIGASLAVGIILACSISAQSPVRHTEGNSVTSGRELYKVQCAYCHGAEGKGDGEAAHLLFPRPRDLTSGLFTLRSTPAGSPPTDDDLLRTITRGIPGSGMPSFSFLNQAERKALVAYVESMSPKFSSAPTKETQSLSLSAQPAESAEIVAAGKAVYEKAHCAACHGTVGQGDGEGARDLEDDAGFPIKVRNFTTGPFKGGASVGDISLRIATGMDGTPMRVRPGLSEVERWQLAYYVKSLCKAASCDATPMPASGLILSARTRRKLPLNDPFAASWNSAPTLRIPLNSLWNRGIAAPDLKVRSLNDGHTIAFLLDWSDSTKNASTVLPQDFSDAVALQFFSGQGNTTLAMGDSNTEVTIWQWKADWQEHIDRGRRSGPEDAHPWMVNDPYPVPGAAAVEAGNPIALTHRLTPVEEATARGFGTVTPKPLNSQLVAGKGVWRDGQWHVVLSRAIAANSGIRTDGETRLGFAVWDGSQGDREGQKAISTWYTLMLGRK
jgi:mono/diheme cytochrome c family protein